MSFRYQFAHSFVWPATFLVLTVASQTSAQDLRPEEKAELRLLNAIATSVWGTIRGNSAREQGLPTHLDNKVMGTDETGPDYGVFNFVSLFQDPLGQSATGRTIDLLPHLGTSSLQRILKR